MPETTILRYGHRLVRDDRVTTHCCLVARAFGAKKIIIVGAQDKEIAESVGAVNFKWGQGIKVEFAQNWKNALKELKNAGFSVVHLTMYGEKISRKINELRKKKKIAVVIGSQKVPGKMYDQSDYNIAIGHQPHSEIAALAVFLDRLFEGRQFDRKFAGGKMEITPSPKGKSFKEKN